MNCIEVLGQRLHFVLGHAKPSKIHFFFAELKYLGVHNDSFPSHQVQVVNHLPPMLSNVAIPQNGVVRGFCLAGDLDDLVIASSILVSGGHLPLRGHAVSVSSPFDVELGEVPVLLMRALKAFPGVKYGLEGPG